MVDPTKLAELFTISRHWLVDLRLTTEQRDLVIAALKFYGANIQRPAKVFRQDGSILEIPHHAV